MRQRVMIAIALACGPKLLFADEPTTALDVTVQAQILDLLQAQQRERFMAMILVTHDLGVVAGRADDIAVMYAGRSSRRRRRATLFAQTRHPYTEALLKSIPKLDAAEPHAARGDHRPPARPREPADGLQVRAALPVRAGRAASRRSRRSATPTSPGHAFRCFYPVGTEAGKTALAANVAAGVTATGMPVERRRVGHVADLGGGLMAGSGTAHLRPPDETLLRVEDLVVEFPVGAPA